MTKSDFAFDSRYTVLEFLKSEACTGKMRVATMYALVRDTFFRIQRMGNSHAKIKLADICSHKCWSIIEGKIDKHFILVGDRDALVRANMGHRFLQQWSQARYDNSAVIHSILVREYVQQFTYLISQKMKSTSTVILLEFARNAGGLDAVMLRFTPYSRLRNELMSIRRDIASLITPAHMEVLEREITLQFALELTNHIYNSLDNAMRDFIKG